MRIYIAGPMRGRPQFNFPAFMAAEEDLRSRGHQPINPAQIDIEEGFDPEHPPEITEDRYRQLLARDLGLLGEVDALAMLPGWEDSNGATIEAEVGRQLGIPVLDYPSLTVANRWPGAPLAEDIDRQCETVKRLLIKKNRAYKNSALEPINIFSRATAKEQLGVRIDDKLKRIAMADPNALGEDSILDLIGYLILYRIADQR